MNELTQLAAAVALSGLGVFAAVFLSSSTHSRGCPSYMPSHIVYKGREVALGVPLTSEWHDGTYDSYYLVDGRLMVLWLYGSGNYSTYEYIDADAFKRLTELRGREFARGVFPNFPSDRWGE